MLRCALGDCNHFCLLSIVCSCTETVDRHLRCGAGITALLIGSSVAAARFAIAQDLVTTAAGVYFTACFKAILLKRVHARDEARFRIGPKVCLCNSCLKVGCGVDVPARRRARGTC